MKRLFITIIGFLVLAISASAQTTTVTGTITDSQGNPYQNGTASAQKVVASGQNPGPPFNTTTNGAGLFSFSGLLALPSPASYIFTICAAPVALGPKANPTPVQQCFSNTVPIAISGASQDVSATLNALAPTLGPQVSNITGNALTATALQNAPAQCGASSLATGITANGTANCTNSPAVTNLTTSGTGTAFKYSNNIRFADQFPGATWDAQVSAAVVDCAFGDANGSGCVVDARGYAQGSKQSMAASVLVGGLSGSIFKPIQLLIGAYTIQSANGATLKVGPGSSVLCAMPPPGQGYPAMASVFQPVSGFTGDVVRLDPADIGTTQPFTRGSVANCGWDMTNAPTATGLKIRSTTYSQPFHNLTFKGGTGTYIDIGLSANAGAQISETLTFDGVDGQWLGAGPSTSPMIKVTGANEVYFKHMGIFSNLSTFDYNSKGIQIFTAAAGTAVYQVHVESSQVGAFGKCVSIENGGTAQPTTPRWYFIDHSDLEGCYYGTFTQGTSSVNEPQFGTFGPGLRFYTPQSDATHLNPVAVYLDFTDHNVVYGDDSNIQPSQGGSTRIFAQSTANATDNLYFGIRPSDIVLAGTRDFLMGPEWSTNGRFYIGSYISGLTNTGTPDDTLTNALNVTQINFNHGTNFANCVRDSAASGKTWCTGGGMGGVGSGDYGFYDQSDSASRADLTSTGDFILSAEPANTTAHIAGSVIPLTCFTSQKTESAADANVLTCAVPAVAGTYRLGLVGSISAASAATLGWTATWTDSNGNVSTPTNLSVCLASTGVCGATTGALSAVDHFSGTYVIDINNAGTSIVIKLTFSGTSFTAKVSATVERII